MRRQLVGGSRDGGTRRVDSVGRAVLIHVDRIPHAAPSTRRHDDRSVLRHVRARPTDAPAQPSTTSSGEEVAPAFKSQRSRGVPRIWRRAASAEQPGCPWERGVPSRPRPGPTGLRRGQGSLVGRLASGVDGAKLVSSCLLAMSLCLFCLPNEGPVRAKAGAGSVPRARLVLGDPCSLTCLNGKRPRLLWRSSPVPTWIRPAALQGLPRRWSKVEPIQSCPLGQETKKKRKAWQERQERQEHLGRRTAGITGVDGA